MRSRLSHFSGLCALVFTFSGLVGCSSSLPATEEVRIPPAPRPPQTQMQQATDLIITPPNPDATTADPRRIPSFGRSPVGLTQFIGEQGGSLVTDRVAALLLIKRNTGALQFVDRSRIDQVMNELKRTNSEFVRLSDTEKAKKLGVLVGADHLLFGSVTEFTSNNMPVPVKEVFVAGERERYQNDYNKYVAETDEAEAAANDNIRRLQAFIADEGSFSPEMMVIGTSSAVQRQLKAQNLIAQNQQSLVQLQAKRQQVRSIDEYERGLRTSQEFATVANVGVTAKLIEVSSGEIVWVYQDNCRHLSLRDGMNVLIGRMLTSLLVNTPGGAPVQPPAVAADPLPPSPAAVPVMLPAEPIAAAPAAPEPVPAAARRAVVPSPRPAPAVAPGAVPAAPAARRTAPATRPTVPAPATRPASGTNASVGM